ncbi:metallophosphoesterase [Paraconexibacter antarcticus]|uniref:Metallophosphoesterase n=1 Tax=Paraconexibacter antarcticus TaxID=2949664 RepID=A0ABY5DUV4_9ACTN|nr:metallophosphoesterase [Paraconexibacter antarcticus]UTI65275.1 metallophosphoesterase [Paraconexibacter antarcticus]
MRTLVISDLHLGVRSGHDVLRQPAARQLLLRELQDVDRLVLLGDTIELLEGRPKPAMRAALPVLRAIGAGLGRGKEVVVVLGNHDHALVRPWLRSQRAGGRRLGYASRVPLTSSSALRAVAAALKPARVQVRYPGVWLADGVWATHGHYLDRHLMPASSTGLLLGRVPDGRATAEDYEHAAGPSAAAVQGLVAASLPGVIGEPLDRAAGLARRASTIALPLAARMFGAGTLAPLSAGALGHQFRRSGMPAMGEVVKRIGVKADHVIFGHLHRAGPRFGDHVPEWSPVGDVHLTNSGCWVYEPLLLAGSNPPHPYWPGGAVVVEDGEAPRAVGLLDELDPDLVR